MAYRAPPGDRVLTLEEFAALPESEFRSELVRGRVVREPPAGYDHGKVAGTVTRLLGNFVEAGQLGDVLGSETGFVLTRDPLTIRAPDAAYVAANRVPAGDLPQFAPFAPDLAVEVVLPSAAFSDVIEKVHEYLDAGTRLVWVLDPRRRTVIVYRSRSDVRVLSVTEQLDGGDVLPGFRVDVRRLFGV